MRLSLIHIYKKVSLELAGDKYLVDNKEFDVVVLATGAWLKDVLEPLGFAVDVRPQKGQLRDYKIKDNNTGAYPVIMPEGELDIIPFENGVVSVGATHENDMGFEDVYKRQYQQRSRFDERCFVQDQLQEHCRRLLRQQG